MGNAERNKFVVKAITLATVELLGQEDLSRITVSQICERAQVSRNSFYRNFSSTEDILRKRVASLLQEWHRSYEATESGSDAGLYGSFFRHLQENASCYQLLQSRGLFHLFRESYLGLFGPKASHSNAEAYVMAFLAGGMLAWVEQWMERGMQESGDQMATLLRSFGVE